MEQNSIKNKSRTNIRKKSKTLEQINNISKQNGNITKQNLVDDVEDRLLSDRITKLINSNDMNNRDLSFKDVNSRNVDFHNSTTFKEPNENVNDYFMTNNINEESKKILVKKISFEFDFISFSLFLFALATRFYKLDQPRNVVFDEIHFGKHLNMYLKNTFYFDVHPPLGYQLISSASYLAGYIGNFKFEHIGHSYTNVIPIFAIRFIPALCGSLIVPLGYNLMIELNYNQKTAAIAAFLLLTENALLTQSKFLLMESMLICFSLFGLLCVVKFCKRSVLISSVQWWLWLILASVSLTFALCVKYVGLYSWYLAAYIIWYDFWYRILGNKLIKDSIVLGHAVARLFICSVIPILVYLTIFYIHFNVLYKAGPHDTVMTSAFQASLKGGLASITKGQPLQIVHGSQVTLRYTSGKPCWLHSHAQMYPIRYSDKRGSSHQQQVTCYTFKDVNNWWIVKNPDKNSITVDSSPEPIKHGDVIQLIHGMTLRALNSHDVGAPMSPQYQEVSCYVDYNISMPAQNLWRVEILNKESTGDIWHTIQSVVRLIHVNSSGALKFSGKHLPDWGFHQYEIVTSNDVNHESVQWNVEEHRYTKQEYDDDKERERDLVNAEMIPIKSIQLSFWSKFIELQYKMLFHEQSSIASNHMYSSEPLEWPTMTRGIAYWISSEHNGQVHLLGNIVTWYSGLLCILLYCLFLSFYLLRRRRNLYDICHGEWRQFVLSGEIFLIGYLLHYIPYFFVERSLFLHHYLPALVFKLLLIASFIQHLDYIIQTKIRIRLIHVLYNIITLVWLLSVFFVFKKFSVFSYGTTPLSAVDIVKLKWKDTWDFIVHKQ